MMKIAFKILCLMVVVCLWSCGAETDNQTTENPSEETAEELPKGEVIKSPTTAEGVVVGLRGSELQLDAKESILLPEIGNDSFVTVFILRPAEIMGANTSLSGEGQMRASMLARTFAKTGIEKIFCEGNAAMQTALSTSKENACELGLVKNEGTDELAKTILKNYMGKRIMVVGSPGMMTDLLGQLSTPAKYAVSSEDYDQIYVVVSKGLGDSEIHHLRY